MKANELRIGNYIVQGCIYSINSPEPRNDEFNDKFIITLINRGLLSIDLDFALPLSISKITIDNISLNDKSMLGGDIVFIEDTKDWIIKNKYGKNIVIGKYVHQLQNLYFALTGVELELTSNIDKGGF